MEMVVDYDVVLGKMVYRGVCEVIVVNEEYVVKVVGEICVDE